MRRCERNGQLARANFRSAATAWAVRGGTPGGFWHLEEAVSGAGAGSPDTLHQVWVRPATGAAPTSGARSVFLVDGNMTAAMVGTTRALVEVTKADGFAQVVALPFPFSFFGASVNTSVAVTSEAYIALNWDAGADTVANSGFGATSPGPALHFGGADRALRLLHVNDPVIMGTLTSVTLVLKYDPINTGSSGWFMNLEVTFANDGTNQFIEIRGGSVVEYRSLFGSWRLTDGDFSLALPVVAAGSSIVLQSDATGSAWTLYSWASLQRSFSPPPACVAARMLAARPSPVPHRLRAAWLRGPAPAAAARNA